jgi:hypothetical protein
VAGDEEVEGQAHVEVVFAEVVAFDADQDAVLGVLLVLCSHFRG